MSEWLAYAFVQAASEFFPISSSGHLALFTHFFHLGEGRELLFALGAHLGSFFALIVFFRHSLYGLMAPLLRQAWRYVKPSMPRVEQSDPATTSNKLASENHLLPRLGDPGEAPHEYSLRWAQFFLVVTLPAGIGGLLLRETIAASFSDLSVLAGGFFISGLMLIVLTQALRLRERGVHRSVHGHGQQSGGPQSSMSPVNNRFTWLTPLKILEINDPIHGNSNFDPRDPLNSALDSDLAPNSNSGLNSHYQFAGPRSRIFWGALCLGLAQLFALFPGVSRSGMTITAGVLLGLPLATSAQISFIMVLPVILGGVGIEVFHIFQSSIFEISWSEWRLLIGVVFASAVFSFLALRLFFSILKRNALYFYFWSVYLLLLSLWTMTLSVG